MGVRRRIVQVIGSEEKGDRGTTAALLKEKFDYIFFTGNPQRRAGDHGGRGEAPDAGDAGARREEPRDRDEARRTCTLRPKRILCLRAFNGGQQCVSPDYVLVEKEVEEAFYEQIRRVEKEW